MRAASRVVTLTLAIVIVISGGLLLVAHPSAPERVVIATYRQPGSLPV